MSQSCRPVWHMRWCYAVKRLRVANAPCSWGVMRGFGEADCFPAYERVLDEMAATGYEGTELGDWGFLPTEAHTLGENLRRRALELIGALVPLPLADASTHKEGVATALRAARLLAACAEEGGKAAPLVILADDNGADTVRTQNAGRIGAEHGLSSDQWRHFARGAELVVRAVLAETGLRTVFHHHCAGFVETPEETERLLELTDPQLVGLCFDTGHYAYAGGDPVDGIRRFSDRIWHVHFKDCYGAIAKRARHEGWDYFEAVRNGVFHGLGAGDVDFSAVLGALRENGYTGWIVVEDELPPGAGDPLESARQDRDFIRGLGI